MFLKENSPSIWGFFEKVNGSLFNILYAGRFNDNLTTVLSDVNDDLFNYKQLQKNDLDELSLFLRAFDKEQIKTFEPHAFDINTLIRLFNNPSFYMFGVFSKSKILGYFFIRSFINKKVFMGRIVDLSYRNIGIAKKMASILHKIAWKSDFRIFSTIDPKNIASLKSQLAVCDYTIHKSLTNGYLLIEYESKNDKSR